MDSQSLGVGDGLRDESEDSISMCSVGGKGARSITRSAGSNGAGIGVGAVHGWHGETGSGSVGGASLSSEGSSSELG